MNERIREITGQVLDELVPETWTTLGYDKIKEIQRRTAELIVRECAEIALLDGQTTGNFEVFNKIQKHFGVES